MLLKPIGYDGSQIRQMSRGDTQAVGTVIPATNSTATNLTITAAMLQASIILRNPAGVSNENIDTAANLVAGLSAGLGSNGIPHGTAFVCRWIVTTANALTVQATANTGVTVTRGTVAATSAKDFLVTVVNGTPAQILAATTTNASANITGLTEAQCALLSIGMIVTNAVANLQGQTIIAIDPRKGQVTMSGNANATGSVSISFSPVVTVEGLAP